MLLKHREKAVIKENLEVEIFVVVLGEFLLSLGWLTEILSES